MRRAREEGVAVDLDELARIGEEYGGVERQRRGTDRTKSFDELVGDDGMLRGEAQASGKEEPASGLRKRGVAGFTAGSAAAVAMSNPFDDDAVLYDHDDDEAPSPKPFTYVEPSTETRDSSATVEASSPPTSGTLIDLSPEPAVNEPTIATPLTPSTPSEADQDPAAQSFYSFTSSPSRPSSPSPAVDTFSTGTLTPRSTRSLSPAPLQNMHFSFPTASNASDHDEADTRSEVFSEGGFTDAGFSEAGFSEGMRTPSEWTEVGSDDGSEWGGMGSVTQTQ